MAAPIPGSVQILQSGQVVYFNADANGSSGSYLMVDTGVTVKVGGVVRATLVEPVWSDSMRGAFWTYGPARVQTVIDDSDGGTAFTITGTGWAGQSSSNVYNDGFSTCSSAAGTCTWNFTGLVPGRYRLSTSLWDIVGPDRSPSVRYRIQDGANTVLFDRSWNQQTTLYPGFDRSIKSVEWHTLATVDLAAGQSVLKVTLSNVAGTGVLAADAVLLESVNLPIAVAGDVVTLDFPAGTFFFGSTGNLAASNFAATFESDATFWPAIPAPAGRTTQVGFNLQEMRCDFASMTLADRSFGADVWSGGSSVVTMDSHFEMVTHPTGTTTKLLIFAPNLDYDSRGVRLLEDGVVRCEFNVTGTWDATRKAACTLTSPAGGYTISSPAIWTDLTGGRWRMEQTITSPTWAPVATRGGGFSPAWTFNLSFQAGAAAGVLTNFKWYDTRTPSSWTSVVHPVDYARLHGTATALRSMKLFETEGNTVHDIGDFIQPADRSDPLAGGNTGYLQTSAHLTALRPADLVTDADKVLTYFGFDDFMAWSVATVDNADLIPDGSNPGWNGAALTLTSTKGGNVYTGFWMVYKIDSTHLLMAHSCDQYDSSASGGQRATITAPVTGLDVTLALGKSGHIAVQTFVAVCAAVGASPWICLPRLCTLACVDAVADIVVAGTSVGVPVYVEYGNETWNGAYQVNYRYYQSQQHFGDGAGHPFPNLASTVAHLASPRLDRFRARFVAAGGGRVAGDVVRVIGVQTADSNYARGSLDQLVLEGKTCDAICFEVYEELRPRGFFSTTGSMGSVLKRLDRDGYIDVFGVSTFNTSTGSMLTDHHNIVNSYGATFAGMRYLAYEGGFEYIASPNKDVGYESPDVSQWMKAEMMASPRMHRLTMAHLAYMQQIGIDLDIRYTYCYAYSIGSRNSWSDLYGVYEQPGTGDPTENVNRAYVPTYVSQQLGGRQDWVQGTDVVPSAMAVVVLTAAASATGGTVVPTTGMCAIGVTGGGVLMVGVG